MDHYPRSGETLKKVVRIYNWVGYALGVLCGVGAGAVTMLLLQSLGAPTWLLTLGTIAGAAAVAGLIIFFVWITGLILWTLSDAAEDADAVKEHLGC